MGNSTTSDLPPLPSYTLTPRPPMSSYLSDPLVQLLAPIIAYWVVSIFFHILDVYDLFPQYRLHTPAEILKRNHVTRYEVFRDVILQQVIQTVFGLVLAAWDPPEMLGKDDYNVAVWAQRLRIGQRHIPKLAAVVGLNSIELAGRVHNSFPTTAAVLMGGSYPQTTGFVSWEMSVAKAIYWVGIPALQFIVGILMVDTWEYFLHRAMHMNKFLYTTLHSRHHRLYVPYAFGALYNHPLEGFLLDTMGSGLAYLATGMTLRQGLCFFTFSTIKTVDDHCGYAFPWDPLQHLTSNNASYHDIHHQSWGIKVNFSQPFFTFWDRLLGTAWTGGDVSSRYQRDRIAAQRKIDADAKSEASSITNSSAIDVDRAKRQAVASQRMVLQDKENGGLHIIREEAQEEMKARQNVATPPRRISAPFDPKTLSDRVNSGMLGKRAKILHADGAQ